MISIRKKHFSHWLLHLFILHILLVSQVYSKNIQCIWTGVERIVAIGDIHGDYNNFLYILKGTGLVDDELHWTGGKSHLVQVGDVLDRGPDARGVFDLMKKLEKEAEKAGGHVHLIIGNHEEANITGLAFDVPGYVTVEQFLSFLPDKDRRTYEKKYRQGNGETVFRKNDPWLPLTEDVNKYWTKIMKSPTAQMKYSKNFNRSYGNWILEKNAIIKINDIIFVHGGVSPRLSTWTLENLNKSVRDELGNIRSINVYELNFPEIKRDIVYEPDGLYWYRELVNQNEYSTRETVDTILSNLGAQYMVVGHTTIRHSIFSPSDVNRFQGRIWTIDVGISSFYGGRIGALLIENGNFTLWRGNNEEKK
ncbi:metallophosphoesterase [Acidobacteriota bacterium]